MWSTVNMLLQGGHRDAITKKNTLNTKLLNWANRLIAAVFTQPNVSGEVSYEVSYFLELFERNVRKNNDKNKKVLLYNSWYTI